MKTDLASDDVPRKLRAGSCDLRETAARPDVIARGAEMRAIVESARRDGKSIGVVPTMGALHEGHLSLVDAARAECDVVVATIFVNPTQFGPQEDFQRYPRNLEADVALLTSRGCDLVFAPSVDEMYPPGSSTFIDVGPLGTELEGAIRPTHFRGVATIVLKLFHLVPGQRAYFGRKDYQQTLVIRQMVDDLNVPIEIRICPIVREADGLAMSSRNAYLSDDQRRQACVLSQSLQLAERLAIAGERDVDAIRRQMIREIERVGDVELQYIAFVKDGTITPVEYIDGPTTVAIAAQVGSTRLIDNIRLDG